MSDDYRESCPPKPTRRTFLLTTGSSVAASVVAAYVPAFANSAAGETRRPVRAEHRGRRPDHAAH